MKANTFKSGFTLLEILIALGLTAIIAGFIISGFQNYSRFQTYEYAVGTVKIAFEESRANAARAVAGSDHGIKIGSTTLTLFEGDTYSGSNPTNVVIDITGAYLTHTLSSGSDEIVFSTLTGLPSATGTVTVQGIIYQASTTIEIEATGAIQ